MTGGEEESERDRNSELVCFYVHKIDDNLPHSNSMMIIL